MRCFNDNSLGKKKQLLKISSIFRHSSEMFENVSFEKFRGGEHCWLFLPRILKGSNQRLQAHDSITLPLCHSIYFNTEAFRFFTNSFRRLIYICIFISDASYVNDFHIKFTPTCQNMWMSYLCRTSDVYLCGSCLNNILTTAPESINLFTRFNSSISKLSGPSSLSPLFYCK